MDVVRRVSQDRLAIDVCVIGSGTGVYEEEFESLGRTILRCPLDRHLVRFYRSFSALLDDRRYDVLHSHVYLFSGVVLRAAAMTGIRQRVAHIHPVEDVKAGTVRRRLFSIWMRRWICRYGTHFVGPTRASMERFWGGGWPEDANKRVIYNGIDVGRFQAARSKSVRDGLDIPHEAKLILNVARFAPHKRQAFLIPIAERLLRCRKDLYFVCIGAGAERDSVMSDVRRADLGRHFRFIEGLPNIDDYWLTADCFAFPSIAEGFGIVVAEAGAAGLPVVAHDIPGVREASAACHDATLLPINAAPERWADVISKVIERGVLSDEQRRNRLERFPFSIEKSIAALESLYGIAAGNGEVER